MRWWWLSFADETGNLGVAVVPGDDEMTAVLVSHNLGINPGGEIQMFELPLEGHLALVDACVLLSRAELEERGLT